jgi:hypothetical protein
MVPSNSFGSMHMRNKLAQKYSSSVKFGNLRLTNMYRVLCVFMVWRELATPYLKSRAREEEL